MPISKRDLLAKALCLTGATKLMERALPRRGLVVWNYHRIGSAENCPFDDGVYSATAEQFRRQVRYLQGNYRLINLDQCLKAAEADFSPGDAAAMITFDDGYRDNFELAFPILRELGAAATFFIPSEFLDSPRLPWWDRIAYIIKRTSKNTLTLEYPTRISFQIPANGRERIVRQVLQAFKSAREMDEPRFFGELQQRAAVEVDAEALGRELFMNWGQLGEMSAAGMDVGSHTHSHPILSRLPEPEQRRELAESKRILERRLDRPIFAIAYPVGNRDAFSETTQRVAGEVGYRLGFSYYGGINWPGHRDHLDLRRCAVDAADEYETLRTRSVLLGAFGKSRI